MAKTQTMEKRFKAIMLPSNKKGWSKGDLIKITSDVLDFAIYDSPGIDNWEAQEIYILDLQAEICKHDTVVSKNGKHVYINVQGESIIAARKTDAIKVIACTNPETKLHGIPQSFLQSIVKAQLVPEWIELETVMTSNEYRDHIEVLQIVDGCIVVSEEPKIIGIGGGELRSEGKEHVYMDPLKVIHEESVQPPIEDAEGPVQTVWEAAQTVWYNSIHSDMGGDGVTTVVKKKILWNAAFEAGSKWQSDKDAESMFTEEEVVGFIITLCALDGETAKAYVTDYKLNRSRRTR